MLEVVVATADSEVDAEVIASRLRAADIPARIRYDSQVGIPRQIAPSGLGFGPGAFRVAVSAEHAAAARDLVSDVEVRPARRSPVLRAVSIVLLIAFALVWVPGVIGALAAIFGSSR